MVACLMEGCNRPRHAGVLCNKHYLEDYFARTPKRKRFKRKLKDEIAEIAELTPYQAKLVVETVLKSITDAINRGETVKIRGFGTFYTHNREPRAYGPRIYFKPSKELLFMVNHPETS